MALFFLFSSLNKMEYTTFVDDSTHHHLQISHIWEGIGNGIDKEELV